MHGLPEFVTVRGDVARALAEGAPVVALESAVISHGLPHPTGLQAAADLEGAVRHRGAVPATIAVRGGRIIIGASPDDMAALTTPTAMKIAGRDLPVAVAGRASGGTTVSATVEIASRAGIRVVCTGGIGGVHRGAEATWDVSADLLALAAHPVAVICSGAKAICDIGRTLEFLETAGVTVVAYGTERFPNFYARDSGYPAPQRAHSPAEAASMLRAKRALGQTTALLVANPVPEPDALAPAEIDDAVVRALARAGAAQVQGGELSPHLLAVIAELTAGRSLRANLSLLRSNAALAGDIAVAVAQSRC